MKPSESGVRQPPSPPNIAVDASPKVQAAGSPTSGGLFPSDKHPKRMIIEFCCGRNSRLGRPYSWNQGCDVIRLTLDDDVTTTVGLKKALDAIQEANRLGIHVLLFVSIPCTGGSMWTNLNKTRGASTRRLIAKRVREGGLPLSQGSGG